MKAIEELLRNLARPDVLEFGLVTNRLPSINVGGRFEPVDDQAPTTDRVIQMLVAMGGARFVDSLSEKPVQWTTRLDGVGVIAVAAIMRKDVVQARFTLARRDPVGARPSPATQVQAGAPPARKDAAASPVVVVRPQQAPTATRAQPAAAPAPAQPAAAEAQKPAAAAPAAAKPEPVPPARDSATDEFEDDDNEPTVQTLSPSGQTPQAAQASPAPPVDEPRPKPARRPEEVAQKPPALSLDEEPAEEESADVEITTSDAGSRRMLAAQPVAIADGEPMEHTVEVVPGKDKKEAPAAEAKEVPPKPKSDPQLLEAKTDPRLDGPKTEAAKMVTGAMPSMPLASAVPSTTPSGVVARDKDRPRVDAAATLDSFLGMAVAAQATDLHIVAGRPVLLRIATDLLARTQPIAPEHVDRIVRDIVPSRLREALDGEGACDFTIDHPQHGRFRMNVSRHCAGAKLSARVLGREVPSIASLALPEPVISGVRGARGLVLVTGPAGQGKTTTLAALVDALNAASARHIYTIEDPIEHVHAKRRGCVTQRELGTHVRSWGEGVADALTSDVDVLVLGELRDDAAINAALVALEGARLVLATMNAPNACKAIARLIEAAPPPEQARARSTVASTLRLVIGQRLVPSADRTKLHAAYEVVRGSVSSHVAIRDGNLDAIRPTLRLDDSLAELVRAQKVTLDVAKELAEAPGELTAAKKG